MSIESFGIPSGNKSKTEAPKVTLSKALAQESDFEEQLTPAETAQAVELLPGDLDNIEDTLETLELTDEEREAKRQTDINRLENTMQEEADDLTSEALRLQITEGLPENQAINKAIIDLCAKLQKEGAAPDQAGGRAMHAFARYLENTAGSKKDDPMTQAKIDHMRNVINKIMGTNVLGLGQEKVSRGGNVSQEVQEMVGGAQISAENQDLDFNKAESGKTDQAPAMFSLADLMRQAQEPPKPGQRPRGQA